MLDDQQQAKLSLLYLHIEGLRAIRRPEFRALIGITSETQEQVSALSASFTERARVIHGRVFTLRNDQLPDLPKLTLELRQMSSELDRAIVRLLGDAVRIRLARIIVDAGDIAMWVEGPGAGCSLQILRIRYRSR